MSEPTNPATLYIRRLQEDASRTGTSWTELGKTVGPPRFSPEVHEHLRDIGERMGRAFQQLGEGFTLGMKVTMPRSMFDRLRRVLIAPDNCRCYTCQRRFPGPWQRVKHERTAHR